MTSNVMGDDEETLFVLVEDTVSLQSFGSEEEDKANTNISEGNCCLLDKPKECSDSIHDDGFVAVSCKSDGIEQHFMDEIMAAMEEDDASIVNEEQIESECSTTEPIIREVLIHTEQKGGFDSAYLSTGAKFRADLYEDNVSIKSYSSDVSNKSLVLVTMKELTPQLKGGNKTGKSSDEINKDDDFDDDIGMDELQPENITPIPSDGEDPSALEYDDGMWQLCAQDTPISPGFRDEPQKVLIRELSYEDELQDAEGVDLMAPVFLAITGEDETVSEHVNDLKRKTKSIEDLCSMTLPPSRTKLRERSVSDLTLNRTMKTIKKMKGISLEKIDDIEGAKLSADDIHSLAEMRKSVSTIKSYASFDDLCLSSIPGGPLCDPEETFEDPDAFIDHEEDDEMDQYDINADIRYPSEEILDNISFSSCQSWKVLSESDLAIKCDDGTSAEPTKVVVKRKDTNALKRSPPPPVITTTECGFLEYPYTERRSPTGSPQKVRCLVSCNTSPSSPPVDSASAIETRIVVNIDGAQRIVDMKLITPYLKVLSHGGHHQVGDECHDIVVFTACFLPSKSLKNYAVIMEQLFFYCVHAVDLIVSDTYEIVFFNSALESKNMPSRKWIKKYYDMIFYKLRKNLKNIYFVHQSLWLKAALQFSKLFVSTKFREKIHLIQNMEMLQQRIPLDYIFIPQSIYDIDKSFQ